MLLAVIVGTHVSWNISSTREDNNTYLIEAKASIDKGWHIYDTEENGPLPNSTVIRFTLPQGASLIGEMSCDTPLSSHFDSTVGAPISVYEGTVTFTQRILCPTPDAQVGVYVEWMACDQHNCTPPYDDEVFIPLDPSAGNAVTSVQTDGQDSIASADEERNGHDSKLWALILEALIWGFAALLTPCVFPMVPMTVSFFMKSSADRKEGRFKALMYGFFIIALYTLPIAAIILVTRIAGGETVTADIFNWLSTHWLPNIIFFTVFMIFAASFLGAFEIELPSSLASRSDRNSDKAGLSGVFFMALTLVLVSFSCTGPIVGTVLIKSTSGEFWTPIITMLCFSAAFALPFAVLAMFPTLLKKMPKSGGWLGSVKVVLGLVEIALGFKFLSVADQTYHWNILSRDIYLTIWIFAFGTMLLYGLGLIGFPSAPKKRKWNALRVVLCTLLAAFEIYLVSGLFGAPLKQLSGYLPPMQTKGWFYDHSSRYDSGASDRDIKYSDFLHLPHGLKGYFDLDQATEEARRRNKPLFIDFTGHGCVNCREMEARVWSDPAVLELLRNEFVICALYCDDKTTLPQKDWVQVGGKTLKTLGKINAHIALTRYNCSAQPYYVLQDADGKLLAQPRSYNLDPREFELFLRSAVNEHGN